MNTVTDTKIVSKYAAKKAAKLAKQAETPEIKKATVVEPAAMQAAAQEQLPDLFGDMFATIMGEDAADLEQMEALRVEAFALMEKSKSFNLKDKGETMRKRVWLLERKVLFEMKDMAERDLQARFGTTKSWTTLKANFDAQALTWKNDRESDVGKKFEALLVMGMNNYPKGKKVEAHKKNLAEAEQLKMDYQNEIDKQEFTYLMGVEKFELANDIAEKHGWEKTSAKGGDGK